MATYATTAVLRHALRGCDHVVHLAAETGTGQSMYEIRRYCDINVLGAAALLEAVAAVREHVERLVVASSRAVYGEGKYSLDGAAVFPRGRLPSRLGAGHLRPALRSHRQAPDTGGEPTKSHGSSRTPSTAATKHSQETMVMLGAASFDVEAVALRFQNVYGPGQSLSNPYTGILSIFSNRILHGHGIDIYEDGLESRDFVYVEDVVESLWLSLTRPEARHEVFGIGSGVPTSVMTGRSTLGEAIRLVSAPAHHRFVPRRRHPPQLCRHHEVEAAARLRGEGSL